MNEQFKINFKPASRAGQITSLSAEQEINESGARLTQCQQVYEAVRACNGGTSREISRASGIPYEIVWRRLSDLADSNYIRRGIARKCTISNRKVLTWWINY